MKQITPEEAIERLNSMQSQIIHGKNTFGECADVIQRLLDERMAYKHSVVATIGGTVEGQPTHEGNYLQRLRELVEKEDENQSLKNFLRCITLWLQRHASHTESEKTEMFQTAYKLYVKHDVEGRLKKAARNL